MAAVTSGENQEYFGKHAPLGHFCMLGVHLECTCDVCLVLSSTVHVHLQGLH